MSITSVSTSNRSTSSSLKNCAPISSSPRSSLASAGRRGFKRAILGPALVAGSLALALGGCPNRDVAKVDPKQSREQSKEIPVQINRNIDILFVIDDSGSMREEQASLVANFQRFINVLNNIEGGLPNVHIGVVSTNVGAGSGIGGCEGNGDNGLLQNAPQGNCDTPTDRYIKDVGLDNGMRDRNYPGEDLAATFSCIAELGTSGCGFEQPLESMRRALNGSNAQNAGFLRKDAFLAVIIISDEDDCSVENSEMFSTDPAQNRVDSQLGLLNSFRCFEFGVQCTPDTPRSAGPRVDCVPRENSPYMYDVGVYANFLKSLKDDPTQILVAGIIGNSEPVNVVSLDGAPNLDASCRSASGEADPAVRINAFLDAFPNRNTSTTICNDDLSDALTQIAQLLAKVLGNACLEGKLKLTDGVPECTVSDIRNLNQDGQQESIIAICNAGMDNLPCYHFVKDEEKCSNTDLYDSQLTLVIERGQADVPMNTTVVAHCVAE